MHLILSSSQSQKYQTYFADLSSKYLFDLVYAGYKNILFTFLAGNGGPANVGARVGPLSTDIKTFKAVYFKSYQYEPEIAHTLALVLGALGINYVDKEVGRAGSGGKLSMYAQLAIGQVNAPNTYAGHSAAIKNALNNGQINVGGPKMVLKRADADRGIDNFLVQSNAEALEIIEKAAPAIWVLQDFIENNGYYRIMVYGNQAKVAIFRTLEPRPDKKANKAHMYRPKGGSNASLISLADIEPGVVNLAIKAAQVMGRQVAGVDVLIGKHDKQAYLIEVNNNPELVGLNTFKTERETALVEYLKGL